MGHLPCWDRLAASDVRCILMFLFIILSPFAEQNLETTEYLKLYLVLHLSTANANGGDVRRGRSLLRVQTDRIEGRRRKVRIR